MRIVISCYLLCDVINFVINDSFLIKSFSTRPKSQDKNSNILKTKRGFKVKLKSFFIIFKGRSVARNCLRPESAPLTIFGKTGL